MDKYIDKIKRNPKITSTIIFSVLLMGILYISGYKYQEIVNKKIGKKVRSPVFQGLVWVLSIVVVLLLVGLLMSFFSSADPLTVFLFGGDWTSTIFQIIAGLFQAMAK